MAAEGGAIPLAENPGYSSLVAAVTEYGLDHHSTGKALGRRRYSGSG
ncbi:MAG: hypothetical protein WBX25_34205 [Rhodomicrobium sp.]